MTNHKIVHFEIGADDPEKLAEFYTKTFGWEVKLWKESDEPYWLVMAGPQDEPGINGGIYKRKYPVPEGMGVNAYTNTINVEDIDETVKMIKENGGVILEPKMEVKKVGWMVYAKDPQGNMFSAMQMSPEGMEETAKDM